jgi:hypothetical protein
MRVYLGCTEPVWEIDLRKCDPNKDFGKGFYVTALKAHAKIAAQALKKKGEKPMVLEFEYDDFACDHKEDFKLLRFRTCSEQWLDFVILNRNSGEEQKHDYDVVEGPAVTETIISRMEEYLNGMVSKEDFLQELSHQKKSHQVCFCTFKSLQLLRNLNRKPVHRLKHVGKHLVFALIFDDEDDEIDISQAADLFYSSKTLEVVVEESLREDAAIRKKTAWDFYKILREELDS